MIVVCEPQCKSISHLKVNSGFIYGLHLAYPKEKIVFFADTSHFNEVKNLLGDNGINTKKLKHIPIQFNSNKSFSLEGILRYYLLFKKIFNKALLLQVNKIFYLSTGPIILHTIKKLKQQKKYKNICCTFVLHGDLEDIANISYKKPYIPRISVNPKPLRLKGVVVKVFKNINKLPSFLLSKLLHPFSQLYLKYSLFFKKIFRMKKMMMWNHSCQYKYISLSPHVTKNAKKYLDIQKVEAIVGLEKKVQSIPTGVTIFDSELTFNTSAGYPVRKTEDNPLVTKQYAEYESKKIEKSKIKYEAKQERKTARKEKRKKFFFLK